MTLKDVEWPFFVNNSA